MVERDVRVAGAIGQIEMPFEMELGQHARERRIPAKTCRQIEIDVSVGFQLGLDDVRERGAGTHLGPGEFAVIVRIA